MNAATVALWDFRNVRRSRTLRAVILVLGLVFGSLAATQTGGSSAAPGDVVVRSLGSLFAIDAFLLPVVVLPIAALSVTAERTSGSVKTLLAMPTTRRDVLLGKFVSRSAITCLGILAAFVVGGGLLWLRFGVHGVEAFVALLGLTLYYAVVWVGISVGVSALSDSRGRALAGTLGVYFVVGIIWNFVPGVSVRGVLVYLVESLAGLDAMPALYGFVEGLSPTLAYIRAGQSLVFGFELTDAAGGSQFFLQDWFGLVVLLGWLVVPLVVAYPAFRDAEIG